jgi:Na+-driven multidrug efflux pump
VEAIYAGLRVRPIARAQIRSAPRTPETVTPRSFLRFYVPLALTSLISFFVSPLNSAAMSRMPEDLSSLAAWPVIFGLIFMLRSPGLAYNEVVVALLDRPGAFRILRRYAVLLAVGSSLLIVLITATPLATLWLGEVMALPPRLLTMGRNALWLALLLPLLALFQSWYQGIIVNSQRTRGITESVALYFVVVGLVLGIGVALQRFTGLYVAVVAMVVAGVAQVAWLWRRSRPAVAALAAVAVPAADDPAAGVGEGAAAGSESAW